MYGPRCSEIFVTSWLRYSTALEGRNDFEDPLANWY